MPAITASEFELLSFFEAAPTRLDPDVPWVYNELLYEARSAEFSLCFTVRPSYKDVRLVVKCGDAALYDLDAQVVEDVRYHKDKGQEILELIISERDSLWLRIKPILYIGHQVSASGT